MTDQQKKPYLISAARRDMAAMEASEHGLSKEKCVYITLNNFRKDGVRYQLRGLIGFPRDHLIGLFSNPEIQALTRGA